MKINFEKLFNQKNIDFVEEQMEDYLPTLFAQENNCKITSKIAAIEKEINSMNSRRISELFCEYNVLKDEDNTHQNWLAYSIGFLKGLNYEK